MELKTKLQANEGTQEIIVTRDFDLPVELLFKAYEEPSLVEQWMGTKVVRMNNEAFGGYRFETFDPNGNMVFSAFGTIHEFTTGSRIIRTFQMENSPFTAQLEFLDFERLTDQTSRLTMLMVFKSVELRNQMLKLPFAWGLNMAHDRLQEVVSKLPGK